MTNSADPYQLASSSEADWSGSTLFAMAEHIRVQQDKGQPNILIVSYFSSNIYASNGRIMLCVIVEK